MNNNFGVYQAKTIEAKNAGVALDNRVNAGIHPLFGIIVTDNAGVVQGTLAAMDTIYGDTIPRELGISYELVKNNKILTGLANPGTYLLRKNEDLQRIGTELTDIYKNEYVKQYNKGKSVEEAKRIALKYTKTVEDMKLKEHEEDFPVELTRETMNKLKRKNQQGDF